MNMSTLESVKAHTYELIDRLKAICTESGLGNKTVTKNLNKSV